jgi:hypothetical protein
VEGGFDSVAYWQSETTKTATFEALHDEMSIQKAKKKREEREEANVSYWRSS